MCNQRERLIGYVYDECDLAEKAEVQEHLESCAECRTEIAALRSVRTDLQTWNVPDHESVWKPFVPAPAPAWWQQVPRWAMATAAGVVMMSGAAGGAASYAFLNQQPLQQPAPVAQTQTVSGVTVSDVNALEQRMRSLIQTEVTRLNAQVQLVSSREVVSDVSPTMRAALEQQIADLRFRTDLQTETIGLLNANFEQYKRGLNVSHLAMRDRVSQLTSLLENR